MILDFGGQYNQLIARRVREHHVYCEVVPWNQSIEKIKQKNPKGIIFTGGPNITHPHFFKKMGKNFIGKTNVFPYKINIFSKTLVSH